MTGLSTASRPHRCLGMVPFAHCAEQVTRPPRTAPMTDLASRASACFMEGAGGRARPGGLGAAAVAAGGTCGASTTGMIVTSRTLPGATAQTAS